MVECQRTWAKNLSKGSKISLEQRSFYLCSNFLTLALFLPTEKGQDTYYIFARSFLPNLQKPV